MSTETTLETGHATAADLLAAIQPVDGGRDILDPATGELVGRAPEYTVADLESAVTAARGWPSRDGPPSDMSSAALTCIVPRTRSRRTPRHWQCCSPASRASRLGSVLNGIGRAENASDVHECRADGFGIHDGEEL